MLVYDIYDGVYTNLEDFDLRGRYIPALVQQTYCFYFLMTQTR